MHALDVEMKASPKACTVICFSFIAFVVFEQVNW